MFVPLSDMFFQVKATTRRVDDGQWHSVSLRRAGKSGRVTVDESAVDFITPGNVNSYNIHYFNAKTILCFKF